MEAFFSSLPANQQKTSSPDSRRGLVNFVEKVWGHDEWIVNNEKYCGKKLFIKEGFRCSLHFHKIKDETFYVLKGKIFLETEFQGIKKTYSMEVGDSAHIPPLMVHRFTALENSELIEFSTQHFEEDSYRIELSSFIPLGNHLRDLSKKGSFVE